MCGIIGYLGKIHNLELLVNGLKMLQNRGYDSAGISLLNEEFYVEKLASTNVCDSITTLEQNIRQFKNEALNGIAHTRWATHGGKTDNNAHPHISSNGLFSLVHNGIIENYASLKEFLITKGKTFKSDTDTEVVVNLLEYNYEKKNNLTKAIEETLGQIEGTWAFLIQCVQYPSYLICAKTGSPLLWGKNENGYIFTSEPSGFCNEVNEYFVVPDHSFMIFTDNKVFTKKHMQGIIVDDLLEKEEGNKLEKNMFSTSPYPYQHWMLKEIMEQPESIKRCLNNGGRLNGNEIKLGGLDDNRETLIKYEHVKILACGTSLHAGMYGANFLRKWGKFRCVETIDASELTEVDIIDNVLYIVLSQSGETKDVHRAMELIRQKTTSKILGIVNVVASLIARDVNFGVYINAGSEKAVASTKSFIGQAMALIMIGLWFQQKRGLINKNSIQSLLSLELNSLKTLNQSQEHIKILAEKLKEEKHAFILGRSNNYSIALEGALKIKEISYIHAEGYPGGALKHGPFALIEKGTPIILLAPDDGTFGKMHNCAEEVKSRGAYVIILTDKDKNEVLKQGKVYDEIIPVANCGEFTSLLSIIPLQLLSYYIALYKGLNCDFPRNLAKVVTVDG